MPAFVELGYMVYIGVIGESTTNQMGAEIAYEVGRLVALKGALLVSGGLSGVMEHAARGAKSAGGTTVGILPGYSRDEANRYIDIAIPTGLGEARNLLVVRSSDALIAIGGQYGTLSEIAFALKMGKPVVGLSSWEIKKDTLPGSDFPEAETAEEALQIIAAALQIN